MELPAGVAFGRDGLGAHVVVACLTQDPGYRNLILVEQFLDADTR